MKFGIVKKKLFLINTLNGGLFTEYVKIKQEASGFPHYVQNDLEKNNFIENYKKVICVCLLLYKPLCKIIDSTYF